MDKAHVHKLFQTHIHTNKQDGERYYSDDRRHHKTDGVIFTPIDEPYKAKTMPTLFKWKYMDKISLDFKVNTTTRRDGQLAFTCGGKDGYEIDYPLKITDQDYERLLRDISRHRDEVNVIECSYDQWSGNWIYHKLRSDKNRPNHISIVFDTLEVIAQNVSPEELMYRIPLQDPAHDDWRHQAEK